MRNFENITTWEEALVIIKNNAPNGLYEKWAEVEPYGVIEWSNGLILSDRYDNSYNWIDIDRNNIVYQAVYLDEQYREERLVLIAFHNSGDVRGNYTDYFIFKYEDIQGLLYGFDRLEWEEMGGTIEE